MITTVFIDIDNTLLDFDLSARQAMSAALKEYGVSYRDDMFPTFKKINDDEAANNNTLDEKTQKTLKDMFMPSSENSPSDDEFKVIRDECINLLKTNFGELLKGKIDAYPIKHSEPKLSFDKEKSSSSSKIPCKYCRFKLICGNNEERVNTVSKPKKGAKK